MAAPSVEKEEKEVRVWGTVLKSRCFFKQSKGEANSPCSKTNGYLLFFTCLANYSCQVVDRAFWLKIGVGKSCRLMVLLYIAGNGRYGGACGRRGTAGERSFGAKKYRSCDCWPIGAEDRLSLRPIQERGSARLRRRPASANEIENRLLPRL